MKFTASLVPLVLLSALAAGCSSGGGSDSSSSSTNASVQFLVSSSGDAGLFALGGELADVRLVQADGTRSENLLAKATPVELVGLEDSAVLMAGANVAPGTYESMQFEFADGSLFAMDESGAHVTVETSLRTFEAPLATAWSAGGGDETTLMLDVDMTGSVVETSPRVVEFDPDGTVMSGVQPVLLQEFSGPLVSSSATDRRFSIQVIQATLATNRDFEITLTPTTRLVDVDGTRFSTSDSFFASLRDGMTVLKVRGVLTGNRTVDADVVYITDQAGDMEPDVVIEGRILHVDDAAGFFVFLIREIEDGAATATPALEAIGNPSSIDVHFDADTTFQLRDGTTVRPSELAVGQIAHATFREFGRPPFRADLVELYNRPEHRCIRGEIVSVRGMPDEFLIEVKDDHWSWSSSWPWWWPWASHRHDEDEDEDELENVRVVLGRGVEVTLDLRGKPALRPGRLLEGLDVKVCGELHGSSEDPLLVAESVRVTPGHLDKAVVDATSPLRSRFHLATARIKKPFGDPVTGAPLSVVIHPDADFKEKARSEAEFFRLYDRLDDDEYLEVRIKGIATGVAEELEAYDVKVKVRRDKHR